VRLRLILVAATLFLGIGAARARSDSQPVSYRLVQKFSISGDGGYDYISIDSLARRLYVSHGAQLQVIDADTGKQIGAIPDKPGVHGAAIAHELKRGFISGGDEKSITIFDIETLKTIKTVPVSGTDFILYDPFSERVFPMAEKVTVLDGRSGDKVGELDLGGEPEAAVSDGKGTVYVNLEDKKAVAVVDAKGLSVVKTYPIDKCTAPQSISYDAANQRLFVGCRDGLVVLDSATGKAVGKSLVCSGVDASAFDPESKLIFESCNEGVISVIRQFMPDRYYLLIATVPTQIGAKTMAFDPKTKNIYLPTAEIEAIPSSDPHKPPDIRIKPGSFVVLVLAKQ
jgi:DNA-binding beta-propeller fold protein YncE